MWKESLIYDEIKTECELSGILKEQAKFQCFFEGNFNYTVQVGNHIHSFTFRTEKDLFDKEEVGYILNMDDFTYFEHEIFYKEGFSPQMQKVGARRYAPMA